MKVVIDISPLRSTHKTRGIGMYTRRLVEALRTVNKRDQFILTTRSGEVPDADLVHYPYFDLFFHTLPIRHRRNTVVTIHDLTPLVFPNDFPVGLRGRLNFLLQRLALKSVSVIITDSSNSKHDIVRLLGVLPPKVHVISLAADRRFRKARSRMKRMIQKKYRLPESFILYVGDLNPNKNLRRLLDAMSLLTPRFPGLHLVFVGRAFGNRALPEARAIRERIKQLGLTGKVHIRSNVALDLVDDLAAIFSSAKLYIQPSLYEGFGLPILEAFACGTPVIASSAASIPEIAADAALFVDPADTASIAAGIRSGLLLSRQKREILIKKGQQRVAQFSWEKTARQTIAVYRSAMKPQL